MPIYSPVSLCVGPFVKFLTDVGETTLISHYPVIFSTGFYPEACNSALWLEMGPFITYTTIRSALEELSEHDFTPRTSMWGYAFKLYFHTRVASSPSTQT
jgi:hypothetical protein